MLDQIAAYRLMDLGQSGDCLIAFRPPAYVLRHPNKVLWFIHHIRAYYDLWGQPHSPQPTPENNALRHALMDLDTRAVGEASKVFTNSKVVSDRLAAFNGLSSQPLYPPIYKPERFRCDGYGDEIFVVCRIEPHKRQVLLIEAMAHVKTKVRLRLCGRCSSPAYAKALSDLVSELGVADRVIFEDRWISEEEKADMLAGALAAAYLPQDEDSYGYPSLEAAHAQKCVITTTDSGGVLELIEHDRNGLVAEPNPKALAQAMDLLYRDRERAKLLGKANFHRIEDLKIDWNHVVSALTE